MIFIQFWAPNTDNSLIPVGRSQCCCVCACAVQVVQCWQCVPGVCEPHQYKVWGGKPNLVCMYILVQNLGMVVNGQLMSVFLGFELTRLEVTCIVFLSIEISHGLSQACHSPLICPCIYTIGCLVVQVELGMQVWIQSEYSLLGPSRTLYFFYYPGLLSYLLQTLFIYMKFDFIRDQVFGGLAKSSTHLQGILYLGQCYTLILPHLEYVQSNLLTSEKYCIFCVMRLFSLIPSQVYPRWLP